MEINKKPTLLDFIKNKEKLEDFHLCEICKDILKDPVVCKQCESNFCSDCIRVFINQNNFHCINKCKFEESKPSKLVFKALDVLQFKCSFAPCEEVLTYNNYFPHLKECNYVVIACDYCHKQFTKQNHENHLAQCEEFELKCEICEIKLKRRDYLKHDTLICLQEFAILSKKEKNDLDVRLKKMTAEFEDLQVQMISKHDLNKILEKEIMKKDEQNQEIRSRLENLEKQFLDLKRPERKFEIDSNLNNLMKEKIVVGWDQTLSKQGRCTIDPNDIKKLKIDSESCWNHFVINKQFTNENFVIEVELKVSQEQNYVYFGIINENYSNSNNCMCQSPKNSFYIRCNGDIAIDSNRFERKDIAWNNANVVILMKVLLKEKQIYFSTGKKEQTGPFAISGNTFRVVAGTCNKAKGELNILNCFSQ